MKIFFANRIGSEKKCRTLLLLVFFIFLFGLTEGFPANYGLDVTRCEKICNATDYDHYLPQQCAKECPGFNQPSTSGRTDATRIKELESQVLKLQAQTNSLVVAVVLLFCIVLVALPIVVYRGTLLAFFQPLCCASDYKKRVAAKKRQIKRSRSGRGSGDNAPVSRRTLSDGGSGRKGTHPTVDRRRSQSVSGQFSSAQPVASSTIIANEAAIGMKTLMKENSSTTMSPNPDAGENSTTTSPSSRVRHPSESSCAAEASPIMPCTFPSDRGYYNDAMSTSSQGLSTSRTSCSTAPVSTLSASDLLRQSKDLDDSPRDSSKLSCDSQPNSASTPKNSEGSSSCDPDLRSSMRRGRRPSSPDSVINSNILSNSTVATTLSTLHSNV